MSNIVDTLYKDFIRPYYYPVFILFLVIIFSIASYYTYTNYYTSKEKDNKLGKNVANANNRSKEVNIMFFFADWCPHCTNAKPIWADVKKKYADTLVNNQKLVFSDIDCTNNEDPKVQSLVQEYGIQGFPTVKMNYTNPEGKPVVVDFDAKITPTALDQFINTVIKP